MLHYNPNKRMKYKELFSDSFLCPEVASMNKKNGGPVSKKIYVPGTSSISRSVSGNEERSFNNQTISVEGFR
jgi:hypothetical protein